MSEAFEISFCQWINKKFRKYVNLHLEGELLGFFLKCFHLGYIWSIKMNRFFLSFYSLTAIDPGLLLSRSLTGVAVILNYLLDLTRESTGCRRGPVPTRPSWCFTSVRCHVPFDIRCSLSTPGARALHLNICGLLHSWEVFIIRQEV